MSRIYQQKEVWLADVEKCAYVRQQLSYNAGERWLNIYFGFPHPDLYLTNRWLASWLDYIFNVKRMLYVLRHALKSEDFDFLSNLIIRLQKKSVWKQGGGGRVTILHIVWALLDPRPSLLPWPWSQPGRMVLQEARDPQGDSAAPWWQPPLHLLFDRLSERRERRVERASEVGGIMARRSGGSPILAAERKKVFLFLFPFVLHLLISHFKSFKDMNMEQLLTSNVKKSIFYVCVMECL